MMHILFTFCYSVIFVLMSFGIPSSQETNKKETDAKKEALDKLHPSLQEAPTPMGIKLLMGYRHKGGTDFEGNNVGQIWKEYGVKIRYEIGRSQGHAVDLDRKNYYQWHKEQVIHGRKVKVALNKENVLLITIPLDNTSSWYAANFYGEIRKPEDMVDMILMVLTFE